MVSPELLRRYPFFGGLSDPELAGVAMITEEINSPDGAVIFKEGDCASHLYLLISGHVDLLYEIPRPNGIDRSYVGSIHAGEPFGISAFVEPMRFTATAHSNGPARMLVISADALRAMSEVDCRLGYNLYRQVAGVLAQRLNSARVQLAACS